ncbi:MAG: hypothetical protein Aurels2KO_01660 [Aureliella sp.]
MSVEQFDASIVYFRRTTDNFHAMLDATFKGAALTATWNKGRRSYASRQALTAQGTLSVIEVHTRAAKAKAQ